MEQNEKALMDMVKAEFLSNDDIQHILHPDTNIFIYPFLHQVRHIDEILDKKNRAIMLYLTENENTGHWISIIKRGKEIEFYDSYGNSPVELSKGLNMPHDLDISLNKDTNCKRFIQLVKDAGYELAYNPIPHQPDDIDNGTCGRHAVLRTIFSSMRMDKYNEFIQSFSKKFNVDVDTLISGMTYHMIGK